MTGAIGPGKKLIPQGKGRKGMFKGERGAKSPGSCGGGSVGEAEPDNPESRGFRDGRRSKLTPASCSPEF